jgi:hypothetical protein
MAAYAGRASLAYQSFRNHRLGPGYIAKAIQCFHISQLTKFRVVVTKVDKAKERLRLLVIFGCHKLRLWRNRPILVGAVRQPHPIAPISSNAARALGSLIWRAQVR